MKTPDRPGFWWIRDLIDDTISVAHVETLDPEDTRYPVTVVGSDSTFRLSEFDWIAPIDPPPIH